MKLKRNKQGKNDFSLVGLTMGQLFAIQHAMLHYVTTTGSAVGNDVLCGLKNLNLDSIDPSGK